MTFRAGNFMSELEEIRSDLSSALRLKDFLLIAFGINRLDSLIFEMSETGNNKAQEVKMEKMPISEVEKLADKVNAELLMSKHSEEYRVSVLSIAKLNGYKDGEVFFDVNNRPFVKRDLKDKTDCQMVSEVTEPTIIESKDSSYQYKEQKGSCFWGHKWSMWRTMVWVKTRVSSSKSDEIEKHAELRQLRKCLRCGMSQGRVV